MKLIRRAVVPAMLMALGLVGLGASSAAASYQRLCSSTPKPGTVACMALVRTDVRPVKAAALPATATPAGYGPADLQSAYDLSALAASQGSGATVAVIDAYDDPNAETDLAVYRSQFGLPPCTTANGCFHKLNQSGAPSPLPAADSGWAGEEALDVDMVSAICPHCKIDLVEANTPSDPDLGAAVDTAVAAGAKYVSNSYGGDESPADPSETAYDHPGVVMTASSGDSGYGVSSPASLPWVTAVGGTSLSKAANARGWTETAWSGAGSGCSRYETKPAWQTDVGCTHRTVADVSAVADPATGVAVYDSYGAVGLGWGVYGGTSAAAPIIAAVYALGSAPRAGDLPASYPYNYPAALYDVTSGSNGTCTPTYLCRAQAGYDGPTGLGTPDGVAAFSANAIYWPQQGPYVYGQSPALTAGASSHLPVGYTVKSGPCSVSDSALTGWTLTITGVGSCVVEADQPGNASYPPAAPVVQTIAIGKGPTALVGAAALAIPGEATTFSAVLIRQSDGMPLSGQTVVFDVAPGNTCEATTSVTGTATCGSAYFPNVSGFTVFYAGNSYYAATAASAPILLE